MFAHAIVATDRPRRYARQLVSHMGHKCPTEQVADGHRLTLRRDGTSTGWFEVLLVNPDSTPADPDPASADPSGERLVVVAHADDAEHLTKVTEVVARHLVRFGEADRLSVEWTDGDLAGRR